MRKSMNSAETFVKNTQQNVQQFDRNFYIFIRFYFYKLHGFSLSWRKVLGSACFPSQTKPFLAVLQCKLWMGTYGWVQIQPSQPKKKHFQFRFRLYCLLFVTLQFQLIRQLTRRWAKCINCDGAVRTGEEKSQSLGFLH